MTPLTKCQTNLKNISQIACVII